MGTIWSNSDGLRVHLGTRASDEEAGGGETGAVGSYKEVAIVVQGSDFVSNAYVGNANLTLPKGAIVHSAALVEVESAFVLGGTTPTILIGVSGSIATNYLASVSSAQAGAAGAYSIASAGSLATTTPLAADAAITVALGGTSPTVTSAGRLTLRVTYRDVGIA
jgi:hypothetical protein